MPLNEMNKVFILGNVVNDPIYKDNFTRFRIASHRYYRDPVKDEMVDTTFVNCVAFSKAAEVISRILKKGDKVLIEGRLHTHEMKGLGNEGDKVSQLQVVVEYFTKLSLSKEESNGN